MLLFALSYLSLVLAATNCDGTCQYQERKCVSNEASYCDDNSFRLFTGDRSSYPCSDSNFNINARSACYICDNGELTDDGSKENRLCYDNACIKTDADNGEECCTDWSTQLLGAGRRSSQCEEEVRGRICKPHLICNYTQTTPFNGMGQGTCITQQGPRPQLMNGEACVFYDITDSPWTDSPDTLYGCASAYFCDAGQLAAGVDPTTKYGTAGVCKKNIALDPTFPGSPLFPNVDCQGDIHCGFEERCEFDSGGVNGTCVARGQTCSISDSTCGHGAECFLPMAPDFFYDGYCRVQTPLKKGEYCDAFGTCDKGLFCNDEGFCDTVEKCKGCDYEGDECGRGYGCFCPDLRITPKGWTPGCQDGGPLARSNQNSWASSIVVPIYQCMNASMIPSGYDASFGDSSSSNSFFVGSSTSTYNLKKFMDDCGATLDPFILQRFRATSFPFFGQPKCHSGTGPHPDKKYSFGMASRNAAHSNHRLSALSLVAPVLLLVAYLH